ncbi:MAG: chorismate mutase [Alphaproteobacteria bacterium]|nr:chorismate mutase [Alphaproteobacteria bacterium]
MENTNIEELRRQIDTVDDQMHDLLMRRVSLAEQIGRLKAEETGQKPSFAMRTKREIEIMRRLWNRHKGGMDKYVMIRIWREIISACVALQSPVTIAVFMPERGMGNLEIARDYFGTYTPMLSCRSVNLVLKELTQGEANVAILSLNDDKQTCWWYSVAQEYKRSVNIFLKLPLVGDHRHGDGRSVYALSKQPFEETGEDKTLLVAETDGTLSLSTLDLVLKAGGIATNAICDSYMPDMMRKAYLFEVEGYLSDKDKRLSTVVEKENGKITMLRVIGGYPMAFF